jgi:hypothetical protein
MREKRSTSNLSPAVTQLQSFTRIDSLLTRPHKSPRRPSLTVHSLHPLRTRWRWRWRWRWRSAVCDQISGSSTLACARQFLTLAQGLMVTSSARIVTAFGVAPRTERSTGRGSTAAKDARDASAGAERCVSARVRASIFGQADTIAALARDTEQVASKSAHDGFAARYDALRRATARCVASGSDAEGYDGCHVKCDHQACERRSGQVTRRSRAGRRTGTERHPAQSSMESSPAQRKSDRVASADLGIRASAVPHGAGLGLEIDAHEPKASLIALRPLEVVEQ